MKILSCHNRDTMCQRKKKNYSTEPTVNYLISEEIFSIDSVCWRHFVKKGESELNASYYTDSFRMADISSPIFFAVFQKLYDGHSVPKIICIWITCLSNGNPTQALRFLKQQLLLERKCPFTSNSILYLACLEENSA